MELQYTITFLSDWHCGSGLSGGAEADSTVLKDSNSLPYVPGKTIKGLVRDALLEMSKAQSDQYNIAEISLLLGSEVAGSEDSVKGTAYFSSAILPDTEKREITPDLSKYLYRKIASTQITDKGVARENSLRVMEVCIPVTLTGSISGFEEKHEKLLKDALKWIRHLGINRNRGLGRCKMEPTSN